MREQDAQERAEWRPVTQNDTPGVVGSVIIRVPLAADCQRTRSGPPGARWLPHAPDTPGEGGGRYPMVRIGILWPEIGILRRAGDGHALEVSLACRAGLALDAIRRRGRSRWGMSPLVGEAAGGSVPGVLCDERGERLARPTSCSLK